MIHLLQFFHQYTFLRIIILSSSVTSIQLNIFGNSLNILKYSISKSSCRVNFKKIPDKMKKYIFKFVTNLLLT